MTSDDELERRLRALKGLPPDSGNSGASDATGVRATDRPGTSSEYRSGGTGGAGRADTVLEGEVIEPVRTQAGRGGATGGGPVPGRGGGSGGGPGTPGVGTRVVTWSLSEGAAGRIGLWIGIGLVAIGAYYVLAAFFPGIRVAGSLGVALLGFFLVWAGLTGRAGGWSRSIGAILIGFGVLPFIAGMLNLGTNGWGSLGAGLAMLVLALLRRRSAGGWGWQGVVGVVMVVWGGWGVLGNLVPGFPTLGDLIVPAILVLIGLSFLRRGVAPSRPPRG